MHRIRRARRWALSACFVCATAAAAAHEQPPTWASLTPAQKQALAPLQQEWAGVDLQRKQKWIEVASRFGTLSPDERMRVQDRMAEWLRLSPADRNRARLQFQEVRQVPADERQARWQAYQALSPEARRQLAADAKPLPKASVNADLRPAATSTARPSVKRPTEGLPSNAGASAIAAKNAAAAAPVPLQARPGATTHTTAALPTPPLHHQAGMPKIAATPGFVDPHTLLPQRGPQGAAVRTPGATTAASIPADSGEPPRP